MKGQTRTDPLERILRFAGRREPVDHQRTARVRDNVHTQWQAMVGRRRASRRRRWVAWAGTGVAAAATVLMLIFWLPRPGVETARVATVIHVFGSPAAGARGHPMSPLSPGIELRAGSVIETGGGEAAALALASGHELKIAANTRIRIESDALILDGGTIYLDAGKDHRAKPIDVRSTIATVRENGTQYLVRLARETLEVSVREGSVRVIRGTSVDTAHAGEMLEVHTNGSPQRVPILTFGERWDWVTQLISAPAIEGMKLSQFLQWLAREQGWQLDYESPKLARDAADVELHGSIEGLSGEEALSAVMTSTGWRYRLEGGRLYIEQP